MVWKFPLDTTHFFFIKTRFHYLICFFYFNYLPCHNFTSLVLLVLNPLSLFSSYGSVSFNVTQKYCMYVYLRFKGASTSQVMGARNERCVMKIMMAKLYSGTLGGPKVSWHLSYRWGKTPKNLTQETCPDRGSNPGPLRDRRAWCPLAHSKNIRRD